mgnify:CR=1 FL=1
MPKEPIRVIEGTARPYEPFWSLRNAAESESGEPEIEFYGFISEYSWFDDDITPKKFKEDLNRIGGGKPVTVRMNSGGGEVFAASMIKSILVEYPGQVTVLIEGLAASGATIVAMGGDRIKMQESAYFMIHDPSVLTWGTIEDLKQTLEMLKTIKDGLIDTYQTRTRLPSEKLAKMLTDETWLTAHEAHDYGFIDEVIATSSKAPAPSEQMVGITNCLSQYRHVPAALLQASQPVSINPAAELEHQQAADRLRAEVKILAGEKK